MGALEFAVQYSTVTCANCAIGFAVPDVFIRERRRDHTSFYCPAGHTNYFPGESDIEKLRKEVEYEKRMKLLASERAERNAEWAEREKHRAAAFKGVLTKTKKRIGHGVCPCCTRTFENLKRHMTTKHPDYVRAEVES